VQGYYYAYRTREKIDGALSRRREAEKRKRDGLPPLEVPAPSVVPSESAASEPVVEEQPKKKRLRKKKTEVVADASPVEKPPET